MGIPVTMRALQQMSLDGPQDLRLITDAPVLFHANRTRETAVQCPVISP
jgi:hypothetical protein